MDILYTLVDFRVATDSVGRGETSEPLVSILDSHSLDWSVAVWLRVGDE